MKWIRKRSGQLQEFNRRKIEKAVLAAFFEHDPKSVPDVRPLVDRIVQSLPETTDATIEIEALQDLVEVALAIESPVVARLYIRYRTKRSLARTERLRPDNLAMSSYIHAAKYARFRPDLGRRETFEESVARVEAMHVARFPQFVDQICSAFEFVRDRKVLPSMRSMQFGGPPCEQHNARVYNCSFTLVNRPEVFQETFYLLLCGAGVGYSVQLHHVAELPPVGVVDRHEVLHHHVEDSIEGWADALGALIESHMESGPFVEFDYSSVRHEGASLSSGGKAPGHIPLRVALEKIRVLLQKAQGRKLRPIEAHDLMCLLADAVLAGGRRRSALIALFSIEDGEMLRAKAKECFRPAWGEDEGLNDQRQRANNSAVLVRQKVSRSQFMRIIDVARENYGDPGFYFVDGDAPGHEHYGTNPCGEIGLNPVISGADLVESLGLTPEKCRFYEPDEVLTGFAFCNLCEVNVARIENAAELLQAAEAAAFIGTLQATFNEFPYLGEVTEAVQRREALLGVGLTGMADNPKVAFDPAALRAAAARAVETNVEWAPKLGIRPAARVTCVKPSGTASVHLGVVGSGIHPHHARRYFRRITANPVEPPAREFARINPHMVERKPDGNWSIVFPIEAPEDAVTVKEEAALEFMQRVFSVYDNWIIPGTAIPESSPGLTHNVSCTVAVRPEEADSVVQETWDNRDRVAAMAYVPHSIDKAFPFAPREEVQTEEDEVKWNRLISGYRPVDWAAFRESSDHTSPQSETACAGGACEID